MSGRPRSMSMDCQSVFNRVITPTELQSAIASISPDSTTNDDARTDQPDQQEQSEQEHQPRRRNSFIPTLSTIVEEEQDDEVLQFIDSLFH